MSTGNLLLRADASAEIGTGHVMRCLALAQAWQEAGGSAVMASAVLPNGLHGQLRREGLQFARIGARPGSPEDALATASLARDLKAVTVIDGYDFTVDYQRGVRMASRQLMVVDDFARISSYDADVILDQNAGASPGGYRARPPNSVVLLGPAHALLRKEFRQRRIVRRETATVVQSILVTFGGADPDNATLQALDAAVAAADNGGRVRVVIGDLHQYRSSIEHAASRARVPVEVVSAPESMADVLAQTDFAIAAAGTTALELACMGVPAALVPIASNQLPIASNMAALGVAVDVGPCWRDKAKLVQLLREISLDPTRRDVMTVRGQQLVDGYGASRVLSTLCGEGAARS